MKILIYILLFTPTVQFFSQVDLSDAVTQPDSIGVSKVAKTYKTPDVYVEEISVSPPVVKEVESAIPVFVGYTEIAAKDDSDDLLMTPFKICSLQEYQNHFGEADFEEYEITVVEDTLNNLIEVKINRDISVNLYRMHYALQMFFANGGGKCYIVSVGHYNDTISVDKLKQGLEQVRNEDEPTILVIPDAIELVDTLYYEIINSALEQCNTLLDRVTIIDVPCTNIQPENDSEIFRNQITDNIELLKYGAAYYPYLETNLKYRYKEGDVIIIKHTEKNGGNIPNSLVGKTLNSDEVKKNTNVVYKQIIAAIKKMNVILPPSSTLAGVYTKIDSTRGVWKAPANVSLINVIKPTISISNEDQESLNTDPQEGKSINAIRSLNGRGTLVWGARTLAGNDNEWRYISVRRFFNMVEESIKESTYWAVFEPNDANTWVKVRAMLANYLTNLWRQGALVGAKPEDAFYVRCGLGQTMRAQDILNGLLIVEIGMAAVRPAEFIILRFSHKMHKE